MRKPPEISPQKVISQKQEDIITQVREYKLITPLFGGGATAGEGDPLTLIRGTEIRGLLRFWWRACRGGNYKTIEEMKKAEDKIWGAANKKSDEKKNAKEKKEETFLQEKSQGTVQLVVKQQQDEAAPTPYSPDIAPPYAAFPLQENRRENRPLKNVYRDVSFTLTISFPKDFKQEIEAALWAWETLGGLGARTRRGFGALRCISVQEDEKVVAVNLPEASEKGVKEWLDKKLEIHVSKGSWPRNIPHLSKKIEENNNCKLIFRQGKYNEKAEDLWYDLIEALKRFRQARYPSTKPKAKNPGRSMWPEPSTIRDRSYTNQSYPYHRETIPDPPVKKFPRAAFGLPIVFQFKDSNKEKPPRPMDPNSDPRKTVLELKDYERFTSPLILKPLACQNNDTVGLAIILEGTSIGSQQLVLKTQEGKQEQWNAEAFLGPREIVELTDENGKKVKLDAKTDVLQAFIKYL